MHISKESLRTTFYELLTLCDIFAIIGVDLTKGVQNELLVAGSGVARDYACGMDRRPWCILVMGIQTQVSQPHEENLGLDLEKYHC